MAMITYVCANNRCCKMYVTCPIQCECGSESFHRECDEQPDDWSWSEVGHGD